MRWVGKEKFFYYIDTCWIRRDFGKNKKIIVEFDKVRFYLNIISDKEWIIVVSE